MKRLKWKTWHPVLDTRWFIQRGRRGWSVRDTWSFDSYVCWVLSEGTAWLAEHDHGYPGEGTEWDTPEKWKAYLLDLSVRLGTWNDKTFLDNDAFEVSSKAVEEFGRNLGHFWD